MPQGPRLHRYLGTTCCLLTAAGFAGCGNNALKTAADDAVRGTTFEVKSITETGDNAGVVVAETDDGSKIELNLSRAKDTGGFVLDGCQTLEEESGYNCTDVGSWSP